MKPLAKLGLPFKPLAIGLNKPMPPKFTNTAWIRRGSVNNSRSMEPAKPTITDLLDILIEGVTSASSAVLEILMGSAKMKPPTWRPSL